ncbi:neuromedin-K receptor-like [Mya arenaria]|uniref:neuromedin-K receptor-like n=1 Tax=Mya arenaria TaxID=6604 RepID=UPI0022E0D624|nr:neuromedin-K receptor-like [Mya arenaria]
MNAGLWLYLTVLSVFVVFAIFSNALVIYCVVRFKKLRSVTNALICNLAVSDILLAGFVMPQRLHDITHVEDFFEGDVLCKMVNFTPVLIITTSIYTLVCVSFERKRAIQETHKQQMTFAALYKIVPSLWLFGLLISLPTLLEYRVNHILVDEGNSTRIGLSCDSSHMEFSYSMTNAIFLVTVAYIVPVIIMFKNYIEVANFVWKKSKQIQAATRAGKVHYQLFQHRIKVVKLLVVVATIFALSWLPFFITLLYAKITNNDSSADASGFLNLFLLAMATFSTAYNVILYIVYNPSFNKAIKQVFHIRSGVSPELNNMATVQGTRSEPMPENSRVDEGQGKGVHIAHKNSGEDC